MLQASGVFRFVCDIYAWLLWMSASQVDMLSRVLNVADKHTDEIERLATHIRTHPQDLTRLADADKYLYELSR